MNTEYQKARNMEMKVEEIYERIDRDFKNWVKQNSYHFNQLAIQATNKEA